MNQVTVPAHTDQGAVASHLVGEAVVVAAAIPGVSGNYLLLISTNSF